MINTILNESEIIIIKHLESYLKPYHTISIIGIAKNAGKTTVLNTIIDHYQKQRIAITSIGLDGERIDNITQQEKPRIKAYKGMLVATAEECLKQSTIQYVIHQKTSIRTALGVIVIIEVIEEGLVLVAGPPSRNLMKQLLLELEKYKPYKVFVDGALYRKSIASTLLVDGIIFVTGASYSSDINKTVNDTKYIIDQLTNKGVILPEKMYENSKNCIGLYYENAETYKTIEKSLLNQEYLLSSYITSDLSTIYLPGALTDRIAIEIINNRININDLHIIVQDATFLLVSTENYQKLQQIGVKIGVLNQIDIIFVAYNPTSPFSYDYDNNEFKAKLSDKLAFEPINVLKDLG